MTLLDDDALLDDARAARRRRRRAELGGVPADPRSILGDDVIGAWFDWEDAVVTGSGVSSCVDRINAGSPAVQTTDARRPSKVQLANGVWVLQLNGSQGLSVPLIANRNGARKWGWVLFVKYTANGTNPATLAVDTFAQPAASARKGYDVRTTLAHEFRLYDTSGGERKGSRGPVPEALNTWYCETFEYNGDREDSPGVLSAESKRCVFTRNGVVQTLNFTGTGGGSSIPQQLATPTGNFALGAFDPWNNSGVVGQIGWLVMIKGAMANSTEGLLTAAARGRLPLWRPPA